MEPFTEDEKRLLLAEIIKNSQLDVKILGRFIKSNRIEPNWMQMSLPAGRPMAQCMRAVDGLDIKPRGRKRKVTYKEDPDSQSSKEPPSSSSQELPPLPRPSIASKHVPILPRPSSSGSLESPLSQPAAPLPKRKRGRPLYAGREVSGPLRDYDGSNLENCHQQKVLLTVLFYPKYFATLRIKGFLHLQANLFAPISQTSSQPRHHTILLFLHHAQPWLVEMREDSSLGLKTALR
ncbi:hypothetical protein ACHAPT_002940 [Fusarium lateritium]